MSDDKKPKKDLRARLGKTISPNSPGAPVIPGFTPGAPADAPPPPSIAPAAAAPSVPAPAIPAPVMPPAVPPPSIFGGDVPPPPFATPARPSAPPKPAAPADPFAAQPYSQGPQEVRLVFDDKPVADSEVGRQQGGKLAIVAGACVLLGSCLGMGAGSMNSRRVLYNATVRDGHAIHASVATASQTVLTAQQRVDAIVAAAAGQAGQAPRIDYASIEALRALEQPFSSTDYSGKNYQALAGASNDLYTYAANIERLWGTGGMIPRLTASALNEARRAELDRTLTATTEGATSMYGAVLLQATEEQGGGIVGQLAFLEPVADNPARVQARATRGGRAIPLQLFTSESEVGSTPEFVVRIDNAGSRGVLSTQTGAFGEFVNDIRAVKTLVDATVEVQGRLTTALGEVAALQEVMAFGG